MTNKELSNLIRKDLKENGFTSKDVSVRVRNSLYDTAVNITVKNPLVKISSVEEIVKKYSEVDYDPRSMEILAGCNTYVHCQYACGVFDDVAAPLVPIAEKVFGSEKYNGHKIAENDSIEIHIVKVCENESRLYELVKNDRYSNCSHGYVIRCPESLAVAMWRFKNLGTIYA